MLLENGSRQSVLLFAKFFTLCGDALRSLQSVLFIVVEVLAESLVEFFKQASTSGRIPLLPGEAQEFAGQLVVKSVSFADFR